MHNQQFSEALDICPVYTKYLRHTIDRQQSLCCPFMEKYILSDSHVESEF